MNKVSSYDFVFDKLKSIPKKNMPKFQAELLKLIELAQLDNYNENPYFR